MANRRLDVSLTTCYAVSKGNEGDVLKEEEEEAKKRGQKFVNSIMKATIEAIPNSNGMSVVSGVSDLETGDPGDIILRNITESFWQACIDVVNTPRLRVAAVGTPGIGKTTSTPWLIRMLLEKGQTVVYLVRSKDLSEWYYEFVPESDGTVTTNIYPETLKARQIPSLKLPSSYYIVDPGRTKDDCVPTDNFQPKVILVTSPDSGHWGGSNFVKRRRNVRGKFRYFPTWSYEELIHARPILRPDMTEKELGDRFILYGGVPRHIFETDLENLLEDQDAAIEEISFEKAEKLRLVD